MGLNIICADCDFSFDDVSFIFSYKGQTSEGFNFRERRKGVEVEVKDLLLLLLVSIESFFYKTAGSASSSVEAVAAVVAAFSLVCCSSSNPRICRYG